LTVIQQEPVAFPWQNSTVCSDEAQQYKDDLFYLFIGSLQQNTHIGAREKTASTAVLGPVQNHVLRKLL
jgi:hypothetical protein